MEVFLFILFLIFACVILLYLRSKGHFSSPTSSISRIKSNIFTVFVAVFVLAFGESVAHAMEQGATDLPQSAASNSAGASTPSSSFFQGLSGQIPAAPSPGEEVQQQGLPNFLSLPEVETQEQILGAVPERGTAVSGSAPAPSTPPSRPLSPSDLRAMEELFHIEAELKPIIRGMHRELGARRVGELQAVHLVDDLAERYGAEHMPEILLSLREKGASSPYFPDLYNDFQSLRATQGTEDNLHKEDQGLRSVRGRRR